MIFGKKKIFQNLYYESYGNYEHSCGFYVGVLLDDDKYHNLRGFRLNSIVTELDLDEVKNNIKKEIKQYKKKYGVVFIFGYNDLIETIVEDFGYCLTQKSLRKEKLDRINGKV